MLPGCFGVPFACFKCVSTVLLLFLLAFWCYTRRIGAMIIPMLDLILRMSMGAGNATRLLFFTFYGERVCAWNSALIWRLSQIFTRRCGQIKRDEPPTLFEFLSRDFVFWALFGCGSVKACCLFCIRLPAFSSIFPLSVFLVFGLLACGSGFFWHEWPISVITGSGSYKK